MKTPNLSRACSRKVCLPLYLAGCWLLLGGWFWQDPVSTKTQQGNQKLAEQQYGEALQAYRDAQLEDPENARLYYNIGLALQGQRKFEEAITEFDKAIAQTDDINLQADATYNKGLAYLESNDVQKAAEAFTETLKLRPDDEDARYNLEWVRKKIAEQAQKQQQDQQQNQQNQQQQQDQQNQQQDQQSQNQQDQQQQQQQDQQQGEQENQEQQQQQDQEDQDGEEQQQQQQGQRTPGPEGTQTPAAQMGKGDENEDQQRDPQQFPDGTPTPMQIQLSPEEAKRLLDSLEEDADLQKRIQRLRNKKNRKERYW